MNAHQLTNDRGSSWSSVDRASCSAAASVAPDRTARCSAPISGTTSQSGTTIALGVIIFYQFFTRYALNDSASWTEEIARYFLVATVFVGAAVCALLAALLALVLLRAPRTTRRPLRPEPVQDR